MKTSKKTQDFIEYVWSFYAPNDLYGRFFDNNPTKEEIIKAIEIRKTNKKLEFDGDSIDREIVRDIMLYNRGARDLEYDMGEYFKKG